MRMVAWNTRKLLEVSCLVIKSTDPVHFQPKGDNSHA
jgi:hypothetical protein